MRARLASDCRANETQDGEPMMRVLFLTALAAVAGGVAAAGPARADEFPYCSSPGVSVGQDCSFNTLEQCQAAVRGMGTFCDRNPRYTVPTIVQTPAVQTPVGQPAVGQARRR